MIPLLTCRHSRRLSTPNNLAFQRSFHRLTTIVQIVVGVWVERLFFPVFAAWHYLYRLLQHLLFLVRVVAGQSFERRFNHGSRTSSARLASFIHNLHLLRLLRDLVVQLLLP